MAITHGTTVGGSQLPRIYDRLRKRSQRRNDAWYFEPTTDGSKMWREHAAYVAGVKDALNAVQNSHLIEPSGMVAAAIAIDPANWS